MQLQRVDLTQLVTDDDAYNFWQFVQPGTRTYDGTKCLEWQAAKDRGYGLFFPIGLRVSVRGPQTSTRHIRAHRWAWVRLRGPLGDLDDIDHCCENKACVNVFHLDAVPPIVNVERGVGGWSFLDLSRAHAQQTACVYGHPFAGPNLYLKENGERDCITCKTIVGLKRTARQHGVSLSTYLANRRRPAQKPFQRSIGEAIMALPKELQDDLTPSLITVDV